MRENDGNWIQTATGKAFWPLDPWATEVDIIDIAHSLALSGRWTGHVHKHYSVAQHSVLVMQHVKPAAEGSCWGGECYRREVRLCALLHDASEAYISDIARPTKRKMPEYQQIEEPLQNTIQARFGLPAVMRAEVKDADNALLFAEARDLMRRPPMEWRTQLTGAAYTKRIRPWPMWYSEFRFLWEFGKLTNNLTHVMKRWAKFKFENFCYFTLGLGRP